MTQPMTSGMLVGKTAVCYGVGGMGGGIARAFARHGAVVHLCGRTRAKLEAVAADIESAGGTAYVAVVDAYDEAAITAHLDGLDQVDISMNAVGLSVEQNAPMIDIDLDALVRPVAEAARTQFATGRAVARKMITQGHGGVIMALSSTATFPAGFETGGFGVACTAVEGFVRAFGGEVGQHGIRVVALRPNFTPESAGIDFDPADPGGLAPLVERSALHRLPHLREVAETAAFVASDGAGAITCSVVDVSCGSTVR